MKRAPVKRLPSQADLLRLFAYEAETGALTWRVRSGPRAAGGVAGTVQHTGYTHVGVGRVYYCAHRVIWKMVTGADPVHFVDHIDGDRSNNRWGNLRLANNRTNLWNSKLRSDNTSGFKGVQPAYKQPGKWRAVLALGKGKYQHLGTFASPVDASVAWLAAADRQRGEFMRVE